jgi:hypothetical protein
MKRRKFVQVDPASLHLPGSRREGADPIKLQRQLAKYGMSTDSMPPVEVKRGNDGELVIFDGATRATRVAKFLPGALITVEVRRLGWSRRQFAPRRRQAMNSCEHTRLALMDALSRLSLLRPDWWLGQTIANLATTAGKLDQGGVWDLEDDEALSAARTLIQQYSATETGPEESSAQDSSNQSASHPPLSIRST